MRRLLSLLLVLMVVFAAGAALAQGVPGVQIVDDNRAKITGTGTFYLCGDAAVFGRLSDLNAAESLETIADAVSQTTAAGGANQDKAVAASVYAEAALAALNGLAANLPYSEAEASARYVLSERIGGASDVSSQAFAQYAAAYVSQVAVSAAMLTGAYPSAEAYMAAALSRADISADAYLKAHDGVFKALYESYLASAVSPESAAEMAQTIVAPALDSAAELFAAHVLSDAAFCAQLDRYAAQVSGRVFILRVDEEGDAGEPIVANIGRVFAREEATVVLVGLALDLVEAYDTATVLMLGGSAEKATTGHMANLYTVDTRITRAFALNGSTQAHTEGMVGAAFADSSASLYGSDRVQKQFYLLGN